MSDTSRAFELEAERDRYKAALETFLASDTAAFGRCEIDSVSDEQSEQDIAALAAALSPEDP